MACIDRNIQCERYAHPVRWVEGIASRGRFVGVRDPGQILQFTKATKATWMADNRIASPDPVDAAHATSLTSPRDTLRVEEEDQNGISDEESIAFEKCKWSFSITSKPE